MVEQVWSKPDIYQIKVPLPDNPLKYLNSYVIHSDGAWLIIDTGFRRPECQNALLAGIHELGIDLKQAKLFRPICTAIMWALWDVLHPVISPFI